MNEHSAAFFAMLKTILWTIDPIVLNEWQIDKMDGVREFNFNGYCTKWVYLPVNGKTYMTRVIPTEPKIIHLLDHNQSDNVLWANVIGKIARYPQSSMKYVKILKYKRSIALGAQYEIACPRYLKKVIFNDLRCLNGCDRFLMHDSMQDKILCDITGLIE